jgi:hypothetical protein
MKTYIKPIAEVVEIEAEELICASLTGGDSIEDPVGEAGVRSSWLEREDFVELW